MLESAGFGVIERGQRISMVERPDEKTAWRAVSSLGPAVPALELAAADVLRPLVLEALSACRRRAGVFRIRNDHWFVIAERPA